MPNGGRQPLAGTFARLMSYIRRAGEPDAAQDTRAGPPTGESMKIELYRVIHWLAIVALVVWAVYSAYSAIAFS
jgi:hypothetical protein